MAFLGPRIDEVATINSSLTAEEFAKLSDGAWPMELVQGQVITMPPPKPRHGQICARICFLLQQFLESHPVGQILSNDSGVITERDPDTVRGADVAYYSYKSVPKGPLPDQWLQVPPELIFEVLSPDDRWSEVQAKVDEYLRAGVQVVCVVDDQMRHIHAFRPDRPAQRLQASDELTIPDLLPESRLPLAKIFQ